MWFASLVGMAADHVSTEELVKLYLDHAKAWKVLSVREVEECAKLREVGKAYFVTKAKALVAQAGGRAILYSYG